MYGNVKSRYQEKGVDPIEIRTKMSLLKDFCVFDKNRGVTKEVVRSMLSQAKSSVELDRIARKIIDDKLEHTVLV